MKQYTYKIDGQEKVLNINELPTSAELTAIKKLAFQHFIKNTENGDYPLEFKDAFFVAAFLTVATDYEMEQIKTIDPVLPIVNCIYASDYSITGWIDKIAPLYSDCLYAYYDIVDKQVNKSPFDLVADRAIALIDKAEEVFLNDEIKAQWAELIGSDETKAVIKEVGELLGDPKVLAGLTELVKGIGA